MEVDDLQRTVQRSLDVRDFTLLHLWIRFWANGGGACRTKLDAILHGQQALSDNDVHVLGCVIKEL